MARLDKRPAPGHWSEYDLKTAQLTCCGDFKEHMRKEKASLDALISSSHGARPNGECLNFIWSSPVADGQAMYRVTSTAPLVLQHIPYGDAYQVPAPMIRGLRLADIQKDVKAAQWWAGRAKKAAPRG